MELYQRGIITNNDTDGIELTWGNHEANNKVIAKIAFRQGIGNTLAEGTKLAQFLINTSLTRITSPVIRSQRCKIGLTQ